MHEIPDLMCVSVITVNCRSLPHNERDLTGLYRVYILYRREASHCYIIIMSYMYRMARQLSTVPVGEVRWQ